MSSKSKIGETNIAYRTGPKTNPWTVPCRTSNISEFSLFIDIVFNWVDGHIEEKTYAVYDSFKSVTTVGIFG